MGKSNGVEKNKALEKFFTMWKLSTALKVGVEMYIDNIATLQIYTQSVHSVIHSISTVP